MLFDMYMNVCVLKDVGPDDKTGKEKSGHFGDEIYTQVVLIIRA